MIPTNNSEPKHLRIKWTRRTQKSNKNSTKKTRKSHELKEGNQCNHESLHTLGGQILYKMVKKIYDYGARKWEAVQKDGLPRNAGVNIYESLWVGQMTKLPLALKLRYKPLRANRSCSTPSHGHAIAAVCVLLTQALRSRHVSAGIKASRRAQIPSPPTEPLVLVLWLN
jgi:hypothetical protein